MRWLVRLIVLALAIAAVREMRHRQQKVVAIGEDLNDQRRGIAAAETELDATDRTIDDAESRVRELDARITAIEHEHPGGIPDSIRPEYARLVAEHNDAVALYNDLVARQRRLNDDYKAQVDRHNARVAEHEPAHAAHGHHLDGGAGPLEAVRRGVAAAERVHGTELGHGREEIVERVRRARRRAPPVDLPALRRPPGAEAARLERDVDAADRVAADAEDTVPAHGELASRTHRRAHQHDERGAEHDQAGEENRAAHPLTPGGGGVPPAPPPGGGRSPAR